MIKEEINSKYYHSNIEPTKQRLNDILGICKTFQEEGKDRLIYAFGINLMGAEAVERLTNFISEARCKMEQELRRVKRLSDKMVHAYEFATDCNDYFNVVAEALSKIRSHMSPLKKLLERTSPNIHPDKNECKQFGIESKSVFDESVLNGNVCYQKDLFGIDSFPPEVSGLYKELSKFFQMEEECMQLCLVNIELESKIRKAPKVTNAIWKQYFQKTIDKLSSTIMLISDDTIEMLKCICPAYKSYSESPSEELFSQKDYHKHNTTDADHLCLILRHTSYKKYTGEELALWGDDSVTINKVRKVVANFDLLLPEDFKHKDMGRYQFMFCMVFQPNNIKKANLYFRNHYNGKYKTTKEAGVNKHRSSYDEKSKEVKEFKSKIASLLDAKSKNEVNTSLG